MSVKNLDFFFNPRRIAVIGASEDKSSIGYFVFKNLLGKGFKGSVYPVNPDFESVQGVEAYAKITDIRRDIDLAIISLCPKNLPAVLPGVLEECGVKGVKGIVLMCFDFKTRVENAPALQAKISQISTKYGFRVLGPDSLGFH